MIIYREKKDKATNLGHLAHLAHLGMDTSIGPWRRVDG